MPDESDYQLIGKIRALPATDGGWNPAIALTAFARQEDRQRALEAGFQAHLAKPVEQGTCWRRWAAWRCRAADPPLVQPPPINRQ